MGVENPKKEFKKISKFKSLKWEKIVQKTFKITNSKFYGILIRANTKTISKVLVAKLSRHSLLQYRLYFMSVSLAQEGAGLKKRSTNAIF